MNDLAFKVPGSAVRRASYGSVPGIDGLRAISIVSVLLTHLFWLKGPGGYGVFLFFVISGFLITRLLFAELKLGSISLKQFYLRRFFRLYPVLVIFTVCSIIVQIAISDRIHWDELFAAIFYYINYLLVWKEQHKIGVGFEPYQVFWSLSVEEHFYFVFPVVFTILRKPSYLAIGACIVIFTCAMLRLNGAFLYPERIGSWYFGLPTHYRIDSICYGVLLAAICEIDRFKRYIDFAISYWGAGLALFVLLTGFIAVRDPVLKTVLRWPLLGLPFAFFVAVAAFSDKFVSVRFVLNNPAMVQIGKLSYSIYVWHSLVLVVLVYLLPPAIVPLLALIVTFCVSWFSFHYIEMPGIRFGKRFHNARAEGVSQARA